MILTIFAKSHFEWFVLHPNSFIHRLDSQFIHSVPSLCHCIPLRPIWENNILMCCSRVRGKNMQSFEFIIILLNFTFYHLICAVVAVVIFMPVVPLAALICRRLLHPTNGLFCVYFRFSFLFFYCCWHQRFVHEDFLYQFRSFIALPLPLLLLPMVAAV